jgi:hypothetical protein
LFGGADQTGDGADSGTNRGAGTRVSGNGAARGTERRATGRSGDRIVEQARTARLSVDDLRRYLGVRRGRRWIETGLVDRPDVTLITILALPLW